MGAWEESAPHTNYATGIFTAGDYPIFFPVTFPITATRQVSGVRLRTTSYSSGSRVKLALYDGSGGSGAPGDLLWSGSEQVAPGDDYLAATFSAVEVTTLNVWIIIRVHPSDTNVQVKSSLAPGGDEPNLRIADTTAITYTDTLADDPTTRSFSNHGYAAVLVDSVAFTVADTGEGSDDVAAAVIISISDTAEGDDSTGPAEPMLPAITDTGEGDDTVAMVSQAAVVSDTGAGDDAVSLDITIPTIEDTATATDSIARDDTGFFITDTASGDDAISVVVAVTIADTAEGAESLLAPLKTVYDFGGVSYVPGFEGERVIAPIFVITDTATGTDSIGLIIAIADTAEGTDAVSVTRDTIAITDTATGVDAILITGQDPVTPPDAGTGGLEALHVLKLILGNKRSPTRELNIAQSAGGNIFLRTTGHVLGSGEANVLWSGQSYRFDGQKKIAESRDNAQLTLAYDLAAGSAAGVSAAQRQINRFFLDAKRYNEDGEGLPVYLVYRWSDNLGSLPEPAFGQLNYYWEVYHADAPRWPENIHDGRIVTGNVEEAVCNLITSPYPEGMEQQAGFAYGDVTQDAHGVKVASGSNSFLQWSYSPTALLGQFTVEGWFTVYWGSISDDRTIFHVLAGTSSLKIVYEGANDYFRITKIVGGTTYTTTSSVVELEDGDHVHLALVQDADTLRLYVNGSELASISAALFGSLSDITIRLATNPTGPDGIDAAVDGWRIFDEALTATQAAALYNAELEVKTLGETVGPPACFNTNQTERWMLFSSQAYATVMGVSGDVEARAKWRVGVIGIGQGVWAGRRASREALSSFPYLVNFNGASYTSVTPGEGDRSYVAVIDSPNLEILEGRYACLLWARNTAAGSSATVKAGITFSNDVTQPGIKSDGISLSYSTGKWNIYNLGELYIRAKERTPAVLPGVTIFVEFDDVSGSPAFDLDFMLLLPWPYQGLIETASQTDMNYLFNEQPYGYDATGIATYPEIIGVPVTLVPNQYNYVYLLRHQENYSIQFGVYGILGLNLYVTPRFLLPGGLIA